MDDKAKKKTEAAVTEESCAKSQNSPREITPAELADLCIKLAHDPVAGWTRPPAEMVDEAMRLVTLCQRRLMLQKAKSDAQRREVLEPKQQKKKEKRLATVNKIQKQREPINFHRALNLLEVSVTGDTSKGVRERREENFRPVYFEYRCEFPELPLPDRGGNRKPRRNIQLHDKVQPTDEYLQRFFDEVKKSGFTREQLLHLFAWYEKRKEAALPEIRSKARRGSG